MDGSRINFRDRPDLMDWGHEEKRGRLNGVWLESLTGSMVGIFTMLGKMRERITFIQPRGGQEGF